LITSDKPARTSRMGRLVKVSKSYSTNSGWWNAPIIFFAQSMINGYLAANAAIVSKNRCRYLHETNASHVGGSYEASEISDYSATKRDNR
jgi:hypothetical protein